MIITQKNLFDVCEMNIGYYPKIKPVDRPQISSSKQTYNHIMRFVDEGEINHREFFLLLSLDRKNGVIGIKIIGEGGMAGVIADPKLIFQTALLSHADSIIIAHNHPSGNLQPSIADSNLTSRVKDAGTFLSLPLLDHLIFDNYNYYSFADEGNII